MAINCSNLIAQGIAQNCAEPLVAGVEQKGWIVNRADIDFANVEYADGSTNILTALPLKTSKKGFVIEQKGKGFIGSTITFNAKDSGADVTNSITFTVPDLTPETAQNFVDKVMAGEVVIVLENKWKNLRASETGTSGDAAFQIFGYFNGLRLASGTRDIWSADTNGAITLTVEETNAPVSAMYLYNNNYADTLAILESWVA